MEIPNKFVKNAVLYESENYGSFYRHFDIQPGFASLYGDKEEAITEVILEVLPNITLKNRDKTLKVDYWGFFNYETKNLTMVYPSYVQFAICFPYGPELEEQTKRGKCLSFKIYGKNNGTGKN